MEGSGEPLSPLCRAYIYAIHGCLCEVLFVVLILDQEWVFRAALGACSLLAYGTGGLALEGIYLQLRGDCCLLRCFGACPWDHSQLRYNVLGLVALEHGLLWFVGSLLLERLVIANALRLRLGRAWKPPRRPAPRFELTHD